MSKPRTIAALWKIFDEARGTKKPKPATATAIAKLQQTFGKVHPELVASLKVHDGGIHFDSYDLLSVKQILSREDRTQGYVAFAEDSGGNMYAVDPKGRLLGLERGQQGFFVKSRSIAAWFESLAKGLTKGTHVAEDGAIIEKVLAPSVERQDDETQRIEYPFSDAVDELVKKGEVAELKKLLDAGKVQPTAHFWTDATLIGSAAGEFQLGVVKLLLERGCPVDHGAALGKRTALFEACWGKGDAKLVEFLLKRGANPNAVTAYDGTPLHAAIMFDNVALAGVLVRAGGREEGGRLPSQTLSAESYRRS